jgi:hypothetical protein
LEFKLIGVYEKASIVKCINPDFKIEMSLEVNRLNPSYARPRS